MTSTSLHFIFLFVFFGPFSAPLFAHHVVFEEIGQMAGALSYIHVLIPANITGLESMLDSYEDSLRDFQTKISTTDLTASPDYYANLYAKDLYTAFDLARQTHIALVGTFIEDAFRMKTQLDNLRRLMPEDPVPSPGSQHGSPYSWRFRRSLAFSLIKGVFGTVMGLYNRFQLDKLRQQMAQVLVEQDRLIELTNDHDLRISQTEKMIQDLYHALKVITLTDPVATAVALSLARSRLQDDLQRLTHTIQQAQLRRLSVDLLSDTQLKRLFEVIIGKARSSQCQLLIQHPSDLFQVEVSYFYGQDLYLIIHVPMAPSDSVMRLFRLHPFPLPFTDTHFLLPRPSQHVLAISSGMTRLTTELSHADLLDCHQINSMHLCERHGVLRKDLNATCLGALYQQDFPAALKLCPMDVVPQQETVLQLQNNWYLIHSPRPYTGNIVCRNFSNSEIFLKPGANRIFISPSCRLQLADHLLLSDLSMKLDASIKHYEWELNKIEFSEQDAATSDSVLHFMEAENAGQPSLAAIRRSLATNKHSSVWTWVFAALSATGIVAGIFLLFAIYTAHSFLTLKARIIQTVTKFLPSKPVTVES